MSQENVEIVRGHIEAWRAEDAPRAVSFLDPHVVADVSRTGGIDSAFYGPEAITEFFRRFAGTFEDYRWEDERLTDLGSGAVLAVMKETGRGKGSGVPEDRPLATLYTVIDGKTRGSRPSGLSRMPSKPPGCLRSRFGRKGALFMESSGFLPGLIQGAT